MKDKTKQKMIDDLFAYISPFIEGEKEDPPNYFDSFDEQFKSIKGDYYLYYDGWVGEYKLKKERSDSEDDYGYVYMAKKTKGKLVAIVRIRGIIGPNQKIKDTMAMLNLFRKNFCTVIDATPSNMGMVKKAKDYITWGEVLMIL